eukprot:scaffold67810_cov129-Cyclotella_meneghiniana.AAC.1
MLTRALKGLEDVISVTIVMPVWRKTKPNDSNDTHTGWVFSDPHRKSFANSIDLGGPCPSFYPKYKPDPCLGAKTVREIYEKVGDVGG